MEPEQVAAPAAEVIRLLMRPVEEKPKDEKPGMPPNGASGVVIPTMYQEHGHAGQVARRRQAEGAQMRLLQLFTDQIISKSSCSYISF